jgi:hypothetical protein
VSRPRVLSWHVHGSYLFYLSHAACEFFLPVKPGRPEGYSGRSGHFPWPANVHEVAAEEVAALELDCVLFQSRINWFEDQHELLSPAQRRLPRIYVEHDPPREHPVEQRHWVDDPDALLVHVTPFNALMWDSGRTPTRVIEHGVTVPDAIRYTGELERGITVVNNLSSRGRRVGADVFERVRAEVPLDLAGMGSAALGGLGDVPIGRLHGLVARYRFLFNPIRYTRLGLAVCEAMALGVPVVALATTEYATVVENGVSGYADTDVDRLIEAMRALLADPAEARRLGEGARRRAQERFAIDRFVREWEDSFALVTGKGRSDTVGAMR